MNTDLPRPDKTNSWKNLKKIRQTLLPNLSEWFLQDPQRANKFFISADPIIYDYSRQLINSEIMDSLFELADEMDLPDKIEAQFRGEKINLTENRSVLHTALRDMTGKPVNVDGINVMQKINEVLNKTEKFSLDVLDGRSLGATGKKFKNILSIGIGGSYLGPEYLAVSCAAYAKKGMNLLFISNVDGSDFSQKTSGLNAQETLIIIVSKTFTTSETMKNAQTAKEWMLKALGNAGSVIKKHFIAVSTAKDKVMDFGIDEENMFEFWDFVGGRFSATSAAGAVPLSLYLGFENLKKILEGANWMDNHFRNEGPRTNIPVIAGLIDIWNINFMGYKTRAILPYSQAYQKYAPHCQQVEMESNGKMVDITGRFVEYDTGEIIFGEPGTNGQHSFYQLLHQGTNIVPSDFIGFVKPRFNIEDDGISHHEELMTNFFAQPDALAFGKNDSAPHKNFPGNRPSNIFMLKNQDPFDAGILLALVEHRTAVKGYIWGINSFDQFGVELGKMLGIDMRNRIKLWKDNPQNPEIFSGLNPSTSRLFEKFLNRDL